MVQFHNRPRKWWNGYNANIIPRVKNFTNLYKFGIFT